MTSPASGGSVSVFELLFCLCVCLFGGAAAAVVQLVPHRLVVIAPTWWMLITLPRFCLTESSASLMFSSSVSITDSPVPPATLHRAESESK